MSLEYPGWVIKEVSHFYKPYLTWGNMGHKDLACADDLTLIWSLPSNIVTVTNIHKHALNLPVTSRCLIFQGIQHNLHGKITVFLLHFMRPWYLNYRKWSASRFLTLIKTTVRLVPSVLPDKCYSFVAVPLHSLLPTWCSQQAIGKPSHLSCPSYSCNPWDYAGLIQIIQDSMEGITWLKGR